MNMGLTSAMPENYIASLNDLNTTLADPTR